MAGLVKAEMYHQQQGQGVMAPTVKPDPTTSSSKIEDEPGGQRLPTINFEDFVTLLNPKNVASCICCNMSLLTSTPPAFLSGRKSEILKSVCDILNLPYSSSTTTTTTCNNALMEDDPEETMDFPFCHYCTNHRIIKLTKVYEKLLVQQGQFDQLKEAVMKDILRVFVSNMVIEKKVPMQALREARAYDKLLYLFKKHSERKVGNAAEKGVQTEGSSHFISSSLPMVGNNVEVSSSSYYNNNKRRRTAPRKFESHNASEKIVNRRPSWNTSSSQVDHYNQYSHPTTNIPMSSSRDTLNTIVTASTSQLNSGRHHHRHEREETSSLENAMNGVMFMLDENGLLELEDGYPPGVDFANSFDSKENISVNGLQPFDQSTLSDEFHSVLGLIDGLETGDGSFSMEVEIPQSEPVMGKKTSPFKSKMVEENHTGEEEKIIMKFTNQGGIRTSSRKIKARCEICDKLICRDNLKHHIETVHGGEKMHKCRGCDKRFVRRDHHVQHEERHDSNTKRVYFCHRCGNADQESKITGKSTYVSHCVDTHGIEDDVVEFFHFCDAENCMESFKIRDDFLEHLRSHWDMGVSLSCSICEKPFAEKTNLEVHEQEGHQSNEPYYTCQFCHMGFDEENDFSRHILFHKVKIPEEVNHVCDTCGKGFATHTRLRSHRYNVHTKIKEHKRKTKVFESPAQSPSSSQSSYQIASPLPEPTNKPSMPCDICGKVYRNKAFLTKHMQTHTAAEKANPEKTEDQDSLHSYETGRNECKYCSKRLKSTHEFRRHLVTRHKDKHLANGKKHCMVCYNVFPNQDDLDQHFDEKHQKFKCGVCGKMNPNTLLLSQHMKRHTGRYPFTCKICKTGFKNKSVLKTHMKRIHSKTKISSSSESELEEEEDDEEDLEELRNTLTPINDDAVNELLNSHDPNSYDMLDLFQM